MLFYYVLKSTDGATKRMNASLADDLPNTVYPYLHYICSHLPMHIHNTHHSVYI